MATREQQIQALAKDWAENSRWKGVKRNYSAEDVVNLRGSVQIDAGAVIKLRDEGKSLLPIGMVSVEGDFSRGDVIAVRDEQGQEIARGLANYASAEARLLCRKASTDIERLLGYVAEPEIVHRDNLVVTR
mgnify:CR=1 FL=1